MEAQEQAQLVTAEQVIERMKRINKLIADLAMEADRAKRELATLGVKPSRSYEMALEMTEVVACHLGMEVRKILKLE